MDIDKFIKDKGLKVDCIVESDLDVKEYVQYEVRDLIKEAVNEQLRLCIVSQQRELLKAFLDWQQNKYRKPYDVSPKEQIEDWEAFNCS